jgi:PleD family two-component response regulator
MPPNHQQTILVVEDDLDLAEMLIAYFDTQGYRVVSAAWGEKALTLAAEVLPDLVLLDVRLPDIDGYEVCRRLRESHKTRGIPVIFLTERRARLDKLQGLELGAVDYITKPFDIREVRLRVRNLLRRAVNLSAMNTVTGFPEGQAIDEFLQNIIGTPSDGWGIVAITLSGLKTFREMYGFIASDNVLRTASLMIYRVASEVAGENIFCGHLNEHTLLVFLPAENIDKLESLIAEQVGGSLEYFYPNTGHETMTGEVDERLGLWIGQVKAQDGPFASVGDLKAKVLATRRNVLPSRQL